MSIGGLIIEPSWQRRLTVAEYHRMIGAGVFDEDEHLELLEGVIVAMSPQGARHALVIERLNRILVRSLGDELRVRPQLPLTLANHAEPEPDLAVVAAQPETAGAHPATALLVVEVATDSLGKDRGVKAALYARAGIVEYWIVNLVNDSLEVHHDPDLATGRYHAVTVHGMGETVASRALPAVTVRLADLLR